jgi:hypothetical protein
LTTTKKITLAEVQAQAERRGFEVQVDRMNVRVVKKQYRHVNHAFSLTVPFELAPRRTEDFVYLRAYYWMGGYDIDYGVDGKVVIHLSMRHPHFQAQVRVAETFNYASFDQLTWDMAAWMVQIEQGQRGTPQA